MPKKRKQKFKIIRIPLNYEIEDIPQNFKYESNMYLELIENKDKVKDELVDKEYIDEEGPTIEEDEEEFEIEANPDDEYDEGEKDISDKIDDILTGKGKGIRDDKEFIADSDDDDYKEKSEKGYLKKDETKKAPKLSDIDDGITINGGKREKNLGFKGRDNSNDKKELLWKFDIMRRKYKSAVIPEYNEYTDIETLRRSYDSTLRKLSLDDSVANYKKYLIASFMGLEYMSSYFNFDMSGIGQHQIQSMSSYEQILVEIGEQNWIHPDKQWSPFMRLSFLVAINTIIFVITKHIFKKTGSSLFGQINSALGEKEEEPKKKTKMKGPSFKPEDDGPRTKNID